MDGVGNQGKVVSGNTTFGWMWLVVRLVQSVPGVSDHKFFLKESINFLDFFMEIFIKERKHMRIHFLLDETRCVSGPIGF